MLSRYGFFLVAWVTLFAQVSLASGGSLAGRYAESFKDAIFASVIDEDGVQYKADAADLLNYQVDYSSLDIRATNKASGRLVYKINPRSRELPVAIDPVTQVTYSVAGNTLAVVDSRLGAVIGTKELAGVLHPPVLQRDLGRVFLTSRSLTSFREPGLLYVVGSRDLKLEAIVGIESMPQRPVMSPDRMKVLAAQRYGQLVLMDTKTLEVETFNLNRGYPSVPVFSADSRYAFMAMRNGGLAVLDATRKAMAFYKEIDNPNLWRDEIALSPVGKRQFILATNFDASGDQTLKRLLIVVDVTKLKI